MRLEIVEKDEAGAVVATYVQPRSSRDVRVEIIPPTNPKQVWQIILDVFLPAGYPHSVTEDYTPYQIYDSLQAFASSIAGLLSSRAVLEGVGVGDSTASPTAALLLSTLQESAGRLATIAFAHRLGGSLGPECKRWRLAADVLNDAAMLLDCLSPAIPSKPVRTGVLAASGVLRALCGVAAGSAKASLSAHFAKAGNLGELNAKDGSQETVISLCGMMVGTFVVSRVTSKPATWATLLLLLAVHLFMNYKAVSAVRMRTLNRQRANVVFAPLIASGTSGGGGVLNPLQASQRERIFERDGVLRDERGRVLGHCRIGVRLRDILRALPPGEEALADLLSVFEREKYVLWHDGRRQVHIVLMHGATPRDALKAWYHALLLVRQGTDTVRDEQPSDGNGPANGTESPEPSTKAPKTQLTRVAQTLEQTTREFEVTMSRLEGAGWDLDTAALETQSGTRFSIAEGRPADVNPVLKKQQ